MGWSVLAPAGFDRMGIEFPTCRGVFPLARNSLHCCPGSGSENPVIGEPRNPKIRGNRRAIFLLEPLITGPLGSSGSPEWGGRIADLISVNEMIVERLESGQARLESGMTNLSSRFGNIIGSDYERRAAQSARRLVRLGLGIRRARVLLAKTAPDRNEIPELLNEAAENGIVSDDEADDLLLADIILTGEGAGGRRRTPSAKPPSPSTTRTCSGPRGAPEYSKGPQASPSSPPSSVSPPPRGHWTWRTGRMSRSSAPRTKTAPAILNSSAVGGLAALAYHARISGKSRCRPGQCSDTSSRRYSSPTNKPLSLMARSISIPPPTNDWNDLASQEATFSAAPSFLPLVAGSTPSV